MSIRIHGFDGMNEKQSCIVHNMGENVQWISSIFLGRLAK